MDKNPETADRSCAITSTQLLGTLSNGTVMLIANTPDDKIIILPNGPGENGKWQAVAMLAGEGFRILFVTSFHFATGNEAVACAQKVVQEARMPNMVVSGAGASPRTPPPTGSVSDGRKEN